MRLVDWPITKPNRCALVPFVGQTTPTRWVDTGSEMQGPDDHIYASEIGVIEAAKVLGIWTPPGEHRAALREVVRLERELAEAVAENRRLTAVLDAVDVMESRGYTARKKPGRPPKNKEEVPV